MIVKKGGYVCVARKDDLFSRVYESLNIASEPGIPVIQTLFQSDFIPRCGGIAADNPYYGEFERKDSGFGVIRP